MPLYPSTEHFFDDKMLAQMKRGSYLVNKARGKLVDRDAAPARVGESLKQWQLRQRSP
jgi:lactate dehydrogenase-like 2-hydroxyacid dehydrogenase